MSNRIVIIGDSFASGNLSWFYGSFLEKWLPGFEVIRDAGSSRDSQTITEQWIKFLPHLDGNDFLIVVFPFLGRTRLPLKEEYWDRIQIGDGIVSGRFLGTNSFNRESELHELEFFENSYSSDQLLEMLEPQKIINSTRAAEENFFEIVKSLKKITIPKSYVFTWIESDSESKNIDDRRDVTRKIGIWKTLHDDFIESNGKSGLEYDLHWSPKTHLAFAKFIVEEFNLNPIIKII